MSEKKVSKRPVGRPSKKSPPPKIDDNVGIAETSKDPTNFMEMIYGTPEVFKKIFSVLAHLKIDKIYIHFEKNGISILANNSKKDRTLKQNIFIKGSELNRYYCREPMMKIIDHKKYLRMFHTIDKSYYKISMYIRDDNLSELIVNLHDCQISKQVKYKLSLINITGEDEVNENIMLSLIKKWTDSQLVSANYPVSFKLPSDKLKKSITDAINMDINAKLKITLYPESPLRFVYSVNDSEYDEIYGDSNKINLQCPNDAYFICAVKIKEIKSLLATLISEHITIICDENKDIMFKINLSAIQINTFIEVMQEI
jgi:hypothetical protein